jgi:hypothetical protein
MEEKKSTGYDPTLYSEEAKRERFIRVAERRMNRLLNDLRLLGNTSNKSLYSYEPADVAKIFAEIEKKVTEVNSKFNSGKQSKPFRFE